MKSFNVPGIKDERLEGELKGHKSLEGNAETYPPPEKALISPIISLQYYSFECSNTLHSPAVLNSKIEQVR